MAMRRCARCSKRAGRDVYKDVSEFNKQAQSRDGLNYSCRDCNRERWAEGKDSVNANRRGEKVRDFDIDIDLPADDDKRATQARARLESDFAELKPEDFAVGIGNDPTTPDAERSKASAEKRQEWSENMGRFAEALRSGEGLDGRLGEYIAGLAEQERRFANRRLSRSASIGAAHNELSRELFKATAKQFFSDRIAPTGYASKPSNAELKRSVCLLLSDLHFGANLDARGNDVPYRAIEEARRFEYVIRQALDYKPQYRDHSELIVMLDGDVIDGFLQHDQRAGLPLTEQKAVFWHHMRIAIALCAQQYPRVHVECQPGNHGRNIARHPGRATEDKWDGIEWDMYFALSQMADHLPNVTFSIPFRAASIIERYGQRVLMIHGDTEPKLGDPDTRAKENAATFDRLNATRLYGAEVSVGLAGHFHKCRIHPTWIFNGCLVPPNGYARSQNFFGEPCAQVLYEWVEGFPVGDLRRIFVGPAQDRDESLGKLIPPFRFPDARSPDGKTEAAVRLQ